MTTKNPADKAGDLAREADEGRSERTPWLALGGVSTVLASAILVLGAVVLVIYWLA